MSSSFVDRKLHANGLGFHVRDIGSKEPALVFVHYMGGAGRTWDLVAERLSMQHRCVAPDLRGWGESDKPDNGYDLYTQADDVAAIIQSLGISQYFLVGQSMGGKIAQILGARRPGGLRGLILVAPAPPTPMDDVPQAQRDAYLQSYLSPAGVEQALTILAHRPLSPELRQMVIDDTLRGGLAAKRSWFDNGMSLDIRELAGNIDVPTTVIVGDADQVENEPALGRNLGGHIRGTQFIVLPGVGHLSPLEAPDELAAAITTAIKRTQ